MRERGPLAEALLHQPAAIRDPQVCQDLTRNRCDLGTRRCWRWSLKAQNLTTLQLEDSTLREKDPEEIDYTVQAFLNLRPDGFALNVKKQEIALLEFTRAMDTDVQWEARKLSLIHI